MKNDHPEIQPQNLCNTCYAKCSKKETDDKVYKPTQVLNWFRHGNDCTIYKYFHSKQLGGRKRKAGKGRGRPKNHLANHLPLLN